MVKTYDATIEDSVNQYHKDATLELQNRLDRIDNLIEEVINAENEKELMMIREILKGESH